MKTIIQSILHAYLSATIALLVTCASVLIILNFKPIYYSSIPFLEMQNPYSLSTEEIKENYDSLISYNMSWGEKELLIPHLPSSKEGLIHFKEVRTIIQTIQILSLVHLGVFLALILSFKKFLHKAYYLLCGGLLSISFTLFLGIWAWLDFNSLFVLFHKIAFRNDFWIFDYEKDPVILYLPESFFLSTSIGILFLVFLFSLLSIISYFFLKPKKLPPEH